MTKHLQGIGEVEARPAKELKIGDRIMWNYGIMGEVVEIVKETKSQLVIMEKYDSGIYQRRLGKERLIAIQ